MINISNQLYVLHCLWCSWCISQPEPKELQYPKQCLQDSRYPTLLVHSTHGKPHRSVCSLTFFNIIIIQLNIMLVSIYYTSQILTVLLIFLIINEQFFGLLGNARNLSRWRGEFLNWVFWVLILIEISLLQSTLGGLSSEFS